MICVTRFPIAFNSHSVQRLAIYNRSSSKVEARKRSLSTVFGDSILSTYDRIIIWSFFLRMSTLTQSFEVFLLNTECHYWHLFNLFFILHSRIVHQKWKFWLIESLILLFTDSSVEKYFSLFNQLISTDSSVKKIFITVKSVNFHWNNQWKLTDLKVKNIFH